VPNSFLGDGLIIEESFAIAFSPGTPIPDVALARLNADNHQLLGAEASLDDVRIHEALKDESLALLHELQRLEFKLNVLLRLTADLARRNNSLPPVKWVRFSATGLEWIGADAPAVGATGMVDLYINPTLPQPLKLPVSVVGAVPNPLHGEAAQMQFTGLSAPVVDLIEKLIFRHHRRLIASSRHAPS
jgi:hypothetical protein